MAVDVSAAILHLHAENIIHRDIAARNVLVGKDYSVYVTDFGLSRRTSAAAQVATTNTTIGPIQHMSPEAILESEYSEKSDSFSFGVLLWEVQQY
jgi:serine/threonine protein kinase